MTLTAGHIGTVTPPVGKDTSHLRQLPALVKDLKDSLRQGLR
jgi:hypothetical protein